jgi:HEAT repeat protein
MALAPVDGVLPRIIGAIEHPIATHRVQAARALSRFDDPAARRFLDERAARETDPVVRRALAFGLPY